MNKYLALLVSCCVLGGLIWMTHPKSGSSLQYLNSNRCQSCHIDQYQAWEASLHSKMFRPVKNDGDILGDFTSDNPALTFSQSDVEFVVGNRWEQIYARIIDGEYYPLPAKWHIKQQQWVPYKVNNWHDTPMSLKCNGCHTTDFNPQTHQFTEFSVGCEACHGPGAQHVHNEEMVTRFQCRICHFNSEKSADTIIRSVSSTVCGQCHNRGKNTPNADFEGGMFNFPVQFTPGQDLDQAMNQTSSDKYWWGNGIAKARHQEFADWEKSDHAQALRNMKEKIPPQDKEVQESCMACHSTDFRHASAENRPNLETAQFGVTCVACHDPHQVSPYLDQPPAQNQPCLKCHFKNDKCPGDNPPHPVIPCNKTEVECVDCHMPYVVKSGGFFSIRGHGFRIVGPKEAALQSMPSSCQNGQCHEEKSQQWAISAYSQMILNTGNDYENN